MTLFQCIHELSVAKLFSLFTMPDKTSTTCVAWNIFALHKIVYSPFENGEQLSVTLPVLPTMYTYDQTSDPMGNFMTIIYFAGKPVQSHTVHNCVPISCDIPTVQQPRGDWGGAYHIIIWCTRLLGGRGMEE